MLKNSLYNSLGGILRLVVNIVTIPVLIRNLGLQQYGIWTLASSTVAMVMLAESGLSFSTAFFASQDLSSKNDKSLSQTISITVGTMVAIATLTSGLLWFLAPSVAHSFKLDVSQTLIVENTLQISVFAVWSRLIQQVLIGLIQAYQSYGLLNLLSSLQSVSLNLGMIVLAVYGGRPIELMKWQSLICVIFLASHIITAKSLMKDVHFKPCWEYNKWVSISKYSLATWFTFLGSALFSQFDKLLVGSSLGTEVVAVYAGITSLTGQINSLSALPVQPLLPLLSGEVKKNSLTEELRNALRLNALVALGVGSVLLISASFILSSFLGFDSHNKHIFYYATIIYSLYSLNAVGYYVCFGLNLVNICMKVQLVGGVFSILLIAIGTKFFGLTGAILGNSGYFFVISFLNIFAFRNLYIEFSRWFSWISSSILCFFSLCIFTFLIQDDSMLKIGIGVLHLSILICFLMPSNIKFLKWLPINR